MLPRKPCPHAPGTMNKNVWSSTADDENTENKSPLRMEWRQTAIQSSSGISHSTEDDMIKPIYTSKTKHQMKKAS